MAVSHRGAISFGMVHIPVGIYNAYMFRYDKPYEDRADYDQHYFVNFHFDAEGNFRNVQLQVNLFREDEFTITESIVSLDPEIVFAEIQKEYLRATS